jgi:hypothetical protein
MLCAARIDIRDQYDNFTMHFSGINNNFFFHMTRQAMRFSVRFSCRIYREPNAQVIDK